jgi:hypothetical protein
VRGREDRRRGGKLLLTDGGEFGQRSLQTWRSPTSDCVDLRIFRKENKKGAGGGVEEGFIEAAALRRGLGLRARGIEIDGQEGSHARGGDLARGEG